MSGPLGSPVSGSVKAPPQSSAKMDTSVGGGSRPGSVLYPIESSAPTNAHTLDRHPPAGWLGSGDEKGRG